MANTNFAAQLANRKPTNARVCEWCGMLHDFIGKVCQNPDCNSCYQYCIRTENCTWKNQPVAVVKSAPKVDVNFSISQNLKEAFCSWLISTDLIEAKPDTEEAFKEFELYVRESLDPVDTDKTYLKIITGSDGKGSFEILDASKLFKNQDGQYILVDGNKRTRIGRKVAVM